MWQKPIKDQQTGSPSEKNGIKINKKKLEIMMTNHESVIPGVHTCGHQTDGNHWLGDAPVKKREGQKKNFVYNETRCHCGAQIWLRRLITAPWPEFIRFRLYSLWNLIELKTQAAAPLCGNIPLSLHRWLDERNGTVTNLWFMPLITAIL